MDTDDFLQHRKLNLCIILRKPLLCVLHTLGSMAICIESFTIFEIIIFQIL